jgi:hypothetical protein
MASSNLNKKLVYDEIRKSWVIATPEEVVRQQWLQRMVCQLGYPKELIAVEKSLSELPHLAIAKAPERRVDILCYARAGLGEGGLFPLLLIECKKGSLSEDALNQVIGYNDSVGACFVAIVGREEALFRYFDKERNEFVSCSFLPLFKELLQWAHH